MMGDSSFVRRMCRKYLILPVKSQFLPQNFRFRIAGRHTYAAWGLQTSNGGMLTQIRVGTTQGGAERMAIDYTYDSFGNVDTTSELNVATGVNTLRKYGNGNQNELTYTLNQTQGVYEGNYGYDVAGRINFYDGLSLNYGSSHSHAVTGINGVPSFGYDANGNMTSRSVGGVSSILSWNHENQLAQVSSSAGSEAYLYDVGGQRIRKIITPTAGINTTTYYVNPLFEVSKQTGTAVAVAASEFNITADEAALLSPELAYDSGDDVLSDSNAENNAPTDNTIPLDVAPMVYLPLVSSQGNPEQPGSTITYRLLRKAQE